LHSSDISLINVINKIDNKGHTWRKSRCIGNTFKCLPFKFALAFDVR